MSISQKNRSLLVNSIRTGAPLSSPLIVDQLDKIGSKTFVLNTHRGRKNLSQELVQITTRAIRLRATGWFLREEQRFPVMRSCGGTNEKLAFTIYVVTITADFTRPKPLDNIRTWRRDKTATGLYRSRNRGFHLRRRRRCLLLVDTITPH